MYIKKSTDTHPLAETGRWNIGKDFSQILTTMIDECKEYVLICYHGTSTILDEFVVGKNEKNIARNTAINRYCTTLQTLILIGKSQCKEEYKERIDKIEMMLSQIYGLIPGVRIDIVKQSSLNTSYHFEINEELFHYILEYINTSFALVLEIFTKSNIINYQTERFDMHKAKDDYIKRIKEEG